ncbi:MAG: MBL fold metallo-hydrolase [Candidatus Dojkabacteria bacterium]
MNVYFLGVGEAFDETLPNNSLLVQRNGYKLMLDCGFSIPDELWKYNNDTDLIDAIFVSHTHADHYFGIPALFTRWLEEEREKPVSIITTEENIDLLQQLLDFAYRDTRNYYKFDINFISVNKSQQIQVGGIDLEFAETDHTVSNLAVKVSDGENTLVYSGDGIPTRESEELYRSCDLLVHDAYYWDKKSWGHPLIKDLIPMANRLNVKALALTHLERDYRKNEIEKLQEEIRKEDINVFVPKPGDTFEF